MRNTTIALLAALVVVPASASAATLAAMKGTVDAWSPPMLGKAHSAAKAAGYHPVAVQFVQDGNVFLTAERGDEIYGVVVTRSGKLFASNGVPEIAIGSAGRERS